MKPYTIHLDMPKENTTFNYRLSRCRCTVERAFRLLKNRLRCLKEKMEFNMENTINIIKTFAILHNLCIITGDPVIYQQLVEMIFDVHLHNIFCKTQYKFIMF